MPAPMSLDLRLRIVRAVERGSSIRGAARRFAVSPSAAIKLMQRVRATGSPAPARFGGHRQRLLARHETDLARLVAASPDITLAELQAALKRRFGITAGLSTIHNTLRRLGLRLKKKSLRAAEQDRPDVRDCIRAFEGGTTHGGLGWRILDELEGELKRRKSLQNERRTVRERLKAKRAEPESERRDQEIDELEREERLLTDLIKSIRQRHLLEFLTDRGLIANYAFPEEGVTLKSFIWWRRDERDDGHGRRYQSRT